MKRMDAVTTAAMWTDSGVNQTFKQQKLTAHVKVFCGGPLFATEKPIDLLLKKMWVLTESMVEQLHQERN